MIADDIRLSRVMAEAVDRHPDLQLTSQALSITTFRFVPEELRAGVGSAPVEQELDALNRALLDRLQREGETFVSNAVIDGRYVLRACIVNFHTERADVEALPEIVARRGRALRTPRRRSLPDLDQLDGLAARPFDHHRPVAAQRVERLEKGHALGAQLGDPGVEVGDAQTVVVDEVPARAGQRRVGSGSCRRRARRR